MLIAVILSIPVILGVSSLFIKNVKALGVVNSSGYAVLLVSCVIFLRNFLITGGPVSMWGFLYIDSLSVFFLFTTAVVAFAAVVYSAGYIRAETAEGIMTEGRARGYFHLFNIFCLTMLVAPILNNLAIVWIAIEMTTLVSAFLVGFHNIKESIEAAWKYIIICSVGITFALLGIIFFYYTSSNDAGIKSLEWTRMLGGAGNFDPNVVKISLLFIFVGYGTKAGLAPMHNWLPDAHSQALSPVSGLLSGVLLKISLYAILRFVILANASVGYAFSAKLFTLFAIVSLAIASGFILVQKDLKRLLAYSSVENVGLIALGLGMGPYGGVFAALLQAFNHAVTKAFMFFSAGNAVRAYHTNSMSNIRGLISAMPFTGTAIFLGVFALVGMPPFSIFISKLSILASAFRAGHYFITAAALLFIAVAFAGLLTHISGVALGNKPSTVPRRKELLSSKVSLIFLGVFIIGLGVWIPKPFYELLIGCQKIVTGQ